MALRSAPRCATLVGPHRLSSSRLVSSRRCSSFSVPFRSGGYAPPLLRFWPLRTARPRRFLASRGSSTHVYTYSVYYVRSYALEG
ncbi:hypothetical protein ALC57_07445 [Trachymyrmex cornetzi]|uniref:Uncharacterized protein n=1 Tax=Trachymyrmex cornetzi TaxID=471704 RepID=A0A195E4P3_9HYME|nr:hypothetical protein ALC57_07445 [Trachymyrmex cornetzi]